MSRGSRSRILTTHAGSLPRPDALIEANRRFARGESSEGELAELLSSSVTDVVLKQVECGIDIVNDGEFGKAVSAPTDFGAWRAYGFSRLAGWETRDTQQQFMRMRDADDFPDFYPKMWAEHDQAGSRKHSMATVFTAPVTYVGERATARDVAILKEAIAGVDVADAFITAVAPASFNRGNNRYYSSERDFLLALAEALHEEYEAIVAAGFVLQIDDPSLTDEFSLLPRDVSIEDYRKAQYVKIEAVNRALEGIPRERVRYHFCWGSWHGPHTTDVPLGEVVDIILGVNADSFSVEAGNVRHALDYRVWQDVELPQNLVLIPGVVSHATNLVEPPELVAERITNYAEIVGRERVIAGTDCGLGGRVHPELAWAKLRALAEGAKLATHRLWSSVTA